MIRTKYATVRQPIERITATPNHEDGRKLDVFFFGSVFILSYTPSPLAMDEHESRRHDMALTPSELRMFAQKLNEFADQAEGER